METEKRVFRASLHWAAYYGSEQIARLLLDRVRIRCGDRKMTALHVAAMNGHAAIVDLLLANGAEMDAFDNYGRTPLQLAQENGHEAVTALLRSKGAVADLDDILQTYPNKWLKSPRGEFRKYAKFPPIPKSNTIPPELAGSARALISLLNYYCAKSSREFFCRQIDALHRVIIEKLPVDIISILLDEESFDINAAPEACCWEHCGFDALHLAICVHNHPATRLLINSGADILGQCPGCNLNFETALHCAIRHKNEEALRLLLDPGVAVDSAPNQRETGLHEAARQKNVPCMRLLLSNGADIGARNFYGRTILHYAARGIDGKEAKDAVSYLLDRGMDVNVTDNIQNTPLHTTDCAEVAELLLERGADVNARNSMGQNRAHELMLELGFQSECPEEQDRLEKLLDVLLRFRIDINAKDQEGNSVFSIALKEGYPGAGKLLAYNPDVNSTDPEGQPVILLATKTHARCVLKELIRRGVDIDWRDTEGRTILHHIIEIPKHTLLEELKLLLERGVEVDAQDKDGDTALFLAVCYHRPEYVSCLLEAGANANSVNYEGLTPLHSIFDSRSPDPKIIHLLLSYGADANARIPTGSTPLHLAVMMGISHDVISSLLHCGADLEAKDQDGQTPLHLTRGSGDHAALLLSQGADVNARDKHGRTPLHLACMRDSFRVLLDHGSDPNARDAKGYTPLHLFVKTSYAVFSGELLLQRGADVDARDGEGETAVHYIVREQNIWKTEWLELLLDHGARTDIPGRDKLTATDIALQTQNKLYLSIMKKGRQPGYSDGNGEKS